jgi:hypothetical protein
MSLCRMTSDTDVVNETKSVPYPTKYKKFKNKVGKENVDKIEEYLLQKVELAPNSFTVASLFGNSSNVNWLETPLQYIYYGAGNNEEVAAMMLGLFIMDILINDQEDEMWYSAQTNHVNKDVKANCYWRKQALQKAA